MESGRPLRVLLVNTADEHGGAAEISRSLAERYRRRGHEAWLAVGWKRGDGPAVFEIPDRPEGSWGRFWTRVARTVGPGGEAGEGTGAAPGARNGAEGGAGGSTVARVARRLADVWREWDVRRGVEDFHHPGTAELLELPPARPDVVHCHNLHGAYFDLRELPRLSREVPVFLTLHDAWLLSGHCAHSFECERWRIGCGACPDLDIYPAVRRDATAHNWRRKRSIYARSRLHVSTPCRWLMDKVEASILAEGTVDARVIPVGVDVEVFHPGSGPGARRRAREALGLPPTAEILLFAAKGIRDKAWRDFDTMRRVVAEVAEARVGESGGNGEVLFVALGEDAPPERIGRAMVRFVPFQEDRDVVAAHYRAADLYLHAARADTFPLSVLEALACGTPVVATAVGGIPEQVRGTAPWLAGGGEVAALNAASPEAGTGFLAPAGDAAAMAEAASRLLADAALRDRLAGNAAADARSRFDRAATADRYLAWYHEILARDRPETDVGGRPEVDGVEGEEVRPCAVPR